MVKIIGNVMIHCTPEEVREIETAFFPPIFCTPVRFCNNKIDEIDEVDENVYDENEEGQD